MIKYVNEKISLKYLENENKLRKIIKPEKVHDSIQNYKKELSKLQTNIKIEINKIELFKIILNNESEELKKMILDDYLKYYVIKYTEKKKDLNYKMNEKLLSFLKLIIKIRFSENHNHYYDFEYSFDEFIKIILFTQGYKEDILNFLDIFIDINKFCDDIQERIESILDEDDLIIYEISERNKSYTKLVNINFFNLMESLLRAILKYSIELIEKDKAKFFEYIYYLTSLEANIQKINIKFFIFSKEIYNIKYIIKIEEAYKFNHEEFENNYIKIINNLLDQSALLYKSDYNNLFNSILELIKIFDETFKEKNEEYVNLLFFIFRQQYKNIYNEDIRLN